MSKHAPPKLITAAQVAAIWNQRAKDMNFPHTSYTRFSVRQRHRKSKSGHQITPVLQTSVGNLYSEDDAWAVTLQPQKSRKRRVSEDAETAG